MFSSSFLVVLYLLKLSLATNLFECDVSDFYGDFNPDSSTALGDDLKKILHDLVDDHQRIPFRLIDEANQQIDKDPDVEGGVIGVYSLIGKFPFPEVWNREHVWPSSRGVGDNGLAHDDLFHLYPCDLSLNSARGNKFFDECSPEEDSDCESPVRLNTGEEAALGSSNTRDTWAPPPSMRGDLARAIFYLAVRYDGTEDFTNELKLADCNSDETCPENTFGNLTTLLKWNVDDPVSEQELTRVNSICTDFQGTRNPFVDFPQLVNKVFDPENIVENEDNDEEIEDNEEGNLVVFGSIVGVFGLLVIVVIAVGIKTVMNKRKQGKNILQAI